MSATPTRRLFLAALLAAPIAASLRPRAAAARTPALFARDGVALAGSDPVAYVTEGLPLPGRAAHAYAHAHARGGGGARWHFATADHRDRFAAAPGTFVPAYGGWCA